MRTPYLYAGTVLLVILVLLLASLQIKSSTLPSVQSSSGWAINVTDLAEDFNAPNGTAFYILTVQAMGSPSGGLDPRSFYLYSNTSASYQAVVNASFPSVDNLLSQPIWLNANGLGSGQVVFQLPLNQAPSRLLYSSGTASHGGGSHFITAEDEYLPAASRWTSVLITGLITTLQTPNGIPPSIPLDGWIENSSITYRAGDRIVLWLDVGCVPPVVLSRNGTLVSTVDTSINVMSVTANAGFEVASVTPPLPQSFTQCLGGGGFGGFYNVTLVTPSSNYVGPIELGVNVSSKVEPFEGPATVRVSGTITLTGEWAGVDLRSMVWNVAGENVTAAIITGTEGVYRYSVTLPNGGTYTYQVFFQNGYSGCEPEPLTLYSRTPDISLNIACGQ